MIVTFIWCPFMDIAATSNMFQESLALSLFVIIYFYQFIYQSNNKFYKNIFVSRKNETLKLCIKLEIKYRSSQSQFDGWKQFYVFKLFFGFHSQNLFSKPNNYFPLLKTSLECFLFVLDFQFSYPYFQFYKHPTNNNQRLALNLKQHINQS